MRRGGPIILIVMVGLVALLGSSWLARRAQQLRAAPHIPRVLPPGTQSTAQGWSWQQMNGDKPKAVIHAKDVREISAPDKLELEGVELDVYNHEATQYNKVISARAELDQASNTMYSDGDVSITLKVPVNTKPSGQLMEVKSSGVHFDTKTGKASTDRAVAFKYDKGEGTAVGASYDPESGELTLKSQANMIWRGNNPNGIPMHIEAGQVIYKEKESKVYLSPWSKLTRDTLAMNGGNAVVTLDKEHIRGVDALSVQGVDNKPDRRLDYSADHLSMDFDDKGEISHIAGENHAQLISATKAGRTVVHTDRIDLTFKTVNKSSTLQMALATGHAVAESHPVIPPTGDAPEERVLKSDILRVTMRDDGKEIDNVETEAPGTLEFIPQRPDQPYRAMTGSRIWIKYGASNVIESFRAIDVTTRTEPPKRPDQKKPPAPRLTWSKELNATFDPKTAKLTRMEQTHDFRYEEGDRRAWANKATLDQTRNFITLNGAARMSDSTGTTVAKQIFIDQNSGDFTAEGDVNSTRNADSKTDSSMLSNDEPVHARARHMTTTDDNTVIRYEGNAVAWQGADRVQADVIEINRDDGRLSAHGHVISQLLDRKQKDHPALDKNGKPAAPAFTIVRAPELLYTDNNRLAYYSGGVTMDRPDMQIKSQEMRAFLRASSEDNSTKQPTPARPVAVVSGGAAPAPKQDQNSSLDRAFADGNVEIVWTSAARKRVGHSEHAEYYVDEGKVVLNGGSPDFTDSVKGETHGRQLTWFADSNRLIIDGAERAEAHSLIQRK